MARRRLLSESERRSLFGVPMDAASITSHYTLAAEDMELVHRRHGPTNRIGLATQIALMRCPGFGLLPDMDVPDPVLHCLAAPPVSRPPVSDNLALAVDNDAGWSDF